MSYQPQVPELPEFAALVSGALEIEEKRLPLWMIGLVHDCGVAKDSSAALDAARICMDMPEHVDSWSDSSELLEKILTANVSLRKSIVRRIGIPAEGRHTV